jgi:hypothetical protein
MNEMSYVMLFNLPALILGLGVVCAVAWRQNGGRLSALGHHGSLGLRILGVTTMFGLWLVLTLSSLLLAFGAGLVVFTILLFWLGGHVAAVSAVLIVSFLASIPFLWGWALMRPEAQP